MSTFIIAEAGVNHNGRLDLALKLCDAAREAGVDAVKFQTFKTEALLTRAAPLAEYQSRQIGSSGSQFEMIKALELSYDSFVKIKEHCQGLGLRFLSTPDEAESLDFLVDELGVDMVKIGSGEVTNIPFLRAVGGKGLPVILSTGMSWLGEVERALGELRQAGATEVSLLHCTTNYPCPPDEVNLLAMRTLREAFGTKVGYSDHTLGISVPVAAVALGAEIIEKHMTLDCGMPGPDHRASLEPKDLGLMVKAIREIESSLGDGIKRPNASERRTLEVVRKSIVARLPIRAGERFTVENLCVKRAGGEGLPPTTWDLLLGRASPRDFGADEAVAL